MILVVESLFENFLKIHLHSLGQVEFRNGLEVDLLINMFQSGLGQVRELFQNIEYLGLWQVKCVQTGWCFVSGVVVEAQDAISRQGNATQPFD